MTHAEADKLKKYCYDLGFMFEQQEVLGTIRVDIRDTGAPELSTCLFQHGLLYLIDCFSQTYTKSLSTPNQKELK